MRSISFGRRVLQWDEIVPDSSGNENAWALTPLPRRALLVTIFAGKTFFHSLLLAWRESVHRQTDRWTDGRTGPKTLPRPLTREVMTFCGKIWWEAILTYNFRFDYMSWWHTTLPWHLISTTFKSWNFSLFFIINLIYSINLYFIILYSGQL